MPQQLYRCGHCDTRKPLEEFPPSKLTNTGQWCRECHRTKMCGPPTDRACDWCGAVMVVTKRRADEPRVYCSRACKGRHRNQRQAAALLESKPARKCLHCGVEMLRSMRAEARFCSEKCNSAAHSLKRGHGRLGPGRRRDIERAYIIERDGGRCHACGKKCRPDEIHLDHLVPLARGGTHALENIAVACARCNVSRRHCGESQLRLLG